MRGGGGGVAHELLSSMDVDENYSTLSDAVCEILRATRRGKAREEGMEGRREGGRH